VLTTYADDASVLDALHATRSRRSASCWATVVPCPGRRYTGRLAWWAG